MIRPPRRPTVDHLGSMSEGRPDEAGPHVGDRAAPEACVPVVLDASVPDGRDVRSPVFHDDALRRQVEVHDAGLLQGLEAVQDVHEQAQAGFCEEDPAFHGRALPHRLEDGVEGPVDRRTQNEGGPLEHMGLQDRGDARHRYRTHLAQHVHAALDVELPLQLRRACLGHIEVHQRRGVSREASGVVVNRPWLVVLVEPLRADKLECLWVELPRPLGRHHHLAQSPVIATDDAERLQLRLASRLRGHPHGEEPRVNGPGAQRPGGRCHSRRPREACGDRGGGAVQREVRLGCGLERGPPLLKQRPLLLEECRGPVRPGLAATAAGGARQQ
mmetsp:Transcript_50786/g.146533  ORF Transcript_50786/g.146533 Transcript_50786/m.146533 type:complete len:329 (+) Transcript_50786:689-1675(+)